MSSALMTLVQSVMVLLLLSGTGTSDTTAFVNAWTQANAVGGKVIVPAGNYRFATGYDFNTGTVFEFQSGAVICPDTGVTVYFQESNRGFPNQNFWEQWADCRPC